MLMVLMDILWANLFVGLLCGPFFEPPSSYCFPKGPLTSEPLFLDAPPAPCYFRGLKHTPTHATNLLPIPLTHVCKQLIIRGFTSLSLH